MSTHGETTLDEGARWGERIRRAAWVRVRLILWSWAFVILVAVLLLGVSGLHDTYTSGEVDEDDVIATLLFLLVAPAMLRGAIAAALGWIDAFRELWREWPAPLPPEKQPFKETNR